MLLMHVKIAVLILVLMEDTLGAIFSKSILKFGMS